jgi:hypothetical protein
MLIEKADHLEGRNLRIAIAGMRPALEWRGEDAVHFRCRQRNRRRVEPDIALAMRLDQRARIAGVRFDMEGARGMCVEHRVGGDLFVRRQANRCARPIELRHAQVRLELHLDHLRPGCSRATLRQSRPGRTGGFLASLRGHCVRVGVANQQARCIDLARIDLGPAGGGQPAARDHERSATQIADRGDGLAGRETVREFDDRPLGAAENQQIGFRIRQHRATHLVRPVIIMGNAAQAGFDRADHYVAAGKGFATALRIDDDGMIGPLVRFTVRGISVVGAWLAIGGVAIDHRIHVAGGDAEEQIRLAERPESLCRQPVGLTDDADTKTLRLEQTPDQRHAETRVIDVGVAGDEDDVAGIPAEEVHFGTRHR